MFRFSRFPSLTGCKEKIHSRKRGSLLVAATLFLLLFLFIAAMGIDRTRRYMQSKKIQSIADGAAKAGGQAFNQFRNYNNLDHGEARQAMFDYIREHQGPEHLDLYEVESDTYGRGYAMRVMNSPANNTCTRGFSIHHGQLVTTQPGTFKTEILGVAFGSSVNPAPVATKLEIFRRTQPDVTKEPWGDYNDKVDGNVNATGNYGPDGVNWGPATSPMAPMSLDAGETIVAHGRSWSQNACFNCNTDVPYIKDSSIDQPKDSSPPSEEDFSVTLSNGDKIPSYVTAPHANQPGAGKFLGPYIKPDGTMDLKQNQALILFNLDEVNGVDQSENQSIGDYQDLILLVTFNPQSTTASTNYYSAPSEGTSSDPCPPYPQGTIRIGITAYGKSNYLFLPKFVRTEPAQGIKRTSVAEVIPQPTFQTNTGEQECGVYSLGSFEGPSDAFDNGSTNLCAQGSVDLENPVTGGGPGTIYTTENATINHGSHFETEEISHTPQPAQFTESDPSSYEVRLTQSEFLSWNPNSCVSADTYVRAVPDLQWDGPGPFDSPACVTRDNDGDYILDRSFPGTLEQSNGSSVSIYADGSFILNGHLNTVNGGIYAEGNILINGFQATINGDPNLLGGLALWSEKSIDLDGPGITVQGITVAEQSFDAEDPQYRQEGLLYAGGSITLEDNAQLVHETNNYDASYLSNVPWVDQSQTPTNRPLYSNVKVHLIE